MIRLYDFDEVRPEEILNRDIRAEADVEATVDAIIADVRARGDAALIEYAAKFDHAELTDVRVSQAEIEEAFAELEKTDPEFITTLKMAAENIRHFHEQQLHKNFVVNDKPGIVLGQKYTPIQRAGVYVPGGTAATMPAPMRAARSTSRPSGCWMLPKKACIAALRWRAAAIG